MADTRLRRARGLAPLLLLSGVVVMVSVGQAQGLLLSNLHNGLLALALSFVGAYVLHQRPGHREGQLLLAAGVVQGLLFLGRQVGHDAADTEHRWWGWFGVWPTALALALTTFAVLCFPDGRLPSPRWRWVAVVIVVLTGTCAALSAAWPVEYASAGVTAAHPLRSEAPGAAADAWSALAHPTYAALQVLWVVAIVARWRTASAHVRHQLVWLVSAAAVSVVALAAGLVIAGSPQTGLLTVPLVPLAAGWAIVHGQHRAAYSALTWLSRAGADPAALPSELARAAAEAVGAPAATLWMGQGELHAVGVWPERDEVIPPSSHVELASSAHLHVRTLPDRGALTVQRPRNDALPLAQSRLLDDLTSQAVLVLEHLGLAELVDRQRHEGRLEGLSPREQQVLELMARGRSNAAICQELHLSIKTVEPLVSTVFTKLGLHSDAASNRRVLAVLAYLRT